MTPKETYKKEYAEINEKIKALKNQANKLENDYFEANCPYIAGDKVKLLFEDGKTEEAYISFISVRYDGCFDYSFIKANKNGSPSSRKLYIYSWDGKYTIELLKKHVPAP